MVTVQSVICTFYILLKSLFYVMYNFIYLLELSNKILAYYLIEFIYAYAEVSTFFLLAAWVLS